MIQNMRNSKIYVHSFIFQNNQVFAEEFEIQENMNGVLMFKIYQLINLLGGK